MGHEHLFVSCRPGNALSFGVRLKQENPGLPRLALTAMEAPAALGVSDDHFRRHIAPELRWVRRGSKKLVAVRELEAWLDRESKHTLDGVE